MLANWLLIMCVGYAHCGGERGSITSIMVTEVQCRAMLDQSAWERWTYTRCVSPDGTVYHSKKQ